MTASESFLSTRPAGPSYGATCGFGPAWQVIALLLMNACALPSEVDASKTACRDQRDCPAGLLCAAGQCRETLDAGNAIDGGSADAGANDQGPQDAGALETAPCNAGQCPEGQACRNGLCRARCADGCPADARCDASSGLCADREIISCPSRSCRSGQTCFLGLCSAPEPVELPCQDPNFVDGCPPYSICDDSRGAPICRGFPACAEDGDCPIGPRGAACAVRLLSKAPICIPGACETAMDCPPDWQCIPVPLSFRLCTDGAVGAPCSEDAHCDSNDCATLLQICR